MTAQRLLIGLALGLSAATALLLALIDGRWQPPPPHPAEVPAPVAGNAGPAVSGELLVDIAARPLFLPQRRPPEPEAVDAPAPEAAPDPLAGLTLLGIYGSGGNAGVLLGNGTEVSRLRAGGEWQGWRLLSVSATGATLIAADGETRALVLERRPQLGGMVATPEPPAKPANGAAAAPNGRPSTPVERQAALRAARERAARFNQAENKD